MKRYSSLFALLFAVSTLLSACTTTPEHIDPPPMPPQFSSGDDTTPDESTEAPERIKALNIVSGTGEMYPYSDQIKEYLLAPAGSNVADYLYQTNNQAQAIVVAWECLSDQIESIELCYAPADSEQSTVVELPADATSYELYNLYKNTDYVWSVTANLADGTISQTESATFHTTDLGPRTLQISGVYNTRDAGGYVTEDGRIVKQGLLFRGGELPKTLKKDAKEVLVNTLGIKCEIDVRGYGSESDYRKKSPISGATLEYVTIDSYSASFYLADNYRRVFALLANEDNYPIYIHCAGGADRTGTVMFLVGALLGIPEEQLIKEFEFTSFSIYGERNTAPDTLYGGLFKGFREKIEAMPGDTLSEKTASYMRSIGVTEQEIANIRAIMLGDATQITATTIDTYFTNIDQDLDICVSCVGSTKLQNVLLGGNEITDYTFQNGHLLIAQSVMAALPDGKVEITLRFDDGREACCELNKKQAKVNGVASYLDMSDGKLTLDQNSPSVLGTKAIGYGEFVKLDAKTKLSGTNNGMWIAIGSYAFHVRAFSVRTWQTIDGINYTECQPRVELGFERKVLDEGATVYYCVELIDQNTARATMIVFDKLGARQIVTYDFARIEKEISNENACLSIAIRTDEVRELTITE